MKTINEVLNSWNAGYVADNPHKVDGYNKADVLEWLAQKHLLQQTPCTTGEAEQCVHPYESLVFYDGSVDCSKCLVQVFKAGERIA